MVAHVWRQNTAANQGKYYSSRVTSNHSSPFQVMVSHVWRQNTVAIPRILAHVWRQNTAANQGKYYSSRMTSIHSRLSK